MSINFEPYAKKALSVLVSRILDESLIEKCITYKDLAILIKLPEPYTGNFLQNNIGQTLGTMGKLLDTVKLPGLRIPIIQTLVISKTDNLPSFGLTEFVDGYKNLPKNEKRAYVIREHEAVINFGNNWLEVLNALNIKTTKIKQKSSTKKYNPYGSEGSPEHRKVKQYIIDNHNLLGYTGKSTAEDEYYIRSGDKIDVVFRDTDSIYAYEAKSLRSNDEDLERGVFQCVKYKKVMEAEYQVGLREQENIYCSLITERDLPKALKKICKELGINHYIVKVNI